MSNSKEKIKKDVICLKIVIPFYLKKYDKNSKKKRKT